MIKYISIIIIVGIAVTTFFMFTEPLYRDIGELKVEVESYDEALSNSKLLEAERDKLTARYNAVDPENLEKIKKLLPDNLDNIRLILEIEKLALPYGMVLKDVRYNSVKEEGNSEVTAPPGGLENQIASSEYGSWDLEFSVSGTYSNFINFTKDVESNLRIVDVSSIDFSAGTELKSNLPETYRFSFKIKTYWLKN